MCGNSSTYNDDTFGSQATAPKASGGAAGSDSGSGCAACDVLDHQLKEAESEGEKLFQELQV